LKRENFPSFRAAIHAGVDQIMVTTIDFPKIDPGGPPSDLNPFFVHHLLRQRLGYHGPVVTDALNAQALERYSPAQVALMAIRAGDDELLEIAGPSTSSQSNLVPAYNAVLDAVRSGQITIGRIDRSVRRILGLKWKLGLAGDPLQGVGRVNQTVGTTTHLDVARRTTARSITLLKNRDNLLPLEPHTGARVLVAGWGQTSTPLIANEIASRGLTTQALWTAQNPTAEQARQAKAAARKYDLVVIDTFNVWSPQSFGQIRLVNALVGSGTPVVVIAIGTPYDAAYLRRADAFLSTYDYQPVSVNAAVAALFGRVNPQGKLPVTVPRWNHPHRALFPFGFGLSY
jgi:beta-N-acetylhexosaminidase